MNKAEKFMKVARDMANTMSKDPNKKVGCIILDPNTLFIRACGYNGFPLNTVETANRWQREEKKWWVNHAEMSAICSACRHGTSLDKSIAVVTMHPCSACAKAMIQSGISKIITVAPNLEHPRWGEEFKVAQILFEEADIQVIYCEEEPSTSSICDSNSCNKYWSVCEDDSSVCPSKKRKSKTSK